METYSHRHVLIGRIHLVFSCARHSLDPALPNNCLQRIQLVLVQFGILFQDEKSNRSSRKEAMADSNEVFLYCDVVVILFGIIGNVLVIISLVRQKRMLKNNSYFLILQLGICDLTVLVTTSSKILSNLSNLYDKFQFMINPQPSTAFFITFISYFKPLE